MIIPEKYFCAESARERGESLFGTAPLVDTWLLIENSSAWTAKSLPDDALPEPVRVHLAQMQGQIPRSRRLMIRQCHSRRSTQEFWAVRSSESQPEGRRRDFRNDEDLLLADVPMLLRDAELMQPMYLVCTHGKHDQCCAKFGLATFCALRDLVDKAAWECSHLGGDRFAGNILCLPHGLYYGHVRPEDVSQVVADY